MRKVFVVLLAMSLSGLFVSCSEDSTTVTPTPSFGISTSALPAGYTCTPYNFDLQASGGTAPYTWALEAGSTLPAGISLSSEGKLLGVLESAGSFNFSVVCTDAAGTPRTDTEEFTLDIEVPANPALAIYYDGDATVCSSETAAFSALDCYVFIMLDETALDCAYGTEFMLTITDVDNDPLALGTQYTHSYVDYPDYVTLTMGDPFSGIAISFSRGYYYSDGPIQVASFGLLLLESLDNLTFNIEPSPSSEWTRPVVATCDGEHSTQEVTGRRAALNFQ